MMPTIQQAVPWLAVIGLCLAGCSAPPPSLDELNASYDRALARTAPLAANFAPGSPEEGAALARVQGYFDGMSAGSVQARTLQVYAPGAYLNDTLVGIDGSENIRAYFARTVDRARVLRVKFLDRARSGGDYYVRWIMTVEAGGLNGGKPVMSYGVTQFRFDNQGRVLIHKDFWDSGTGLYEHLPVLGRIVQSVRAASH